MITHYSWRVPEISGGDPAFRADDGAADPSVSAALGAFAAGHGSEHAAMTVLAASRLLVPIVAAAGDGEKASEMALPTLIGLDGRPALPAFTCAESMRTWQRDARPVPVAASAVWQAASEGSCAVVVDIAGPVPFAVEGARLVALARGEAAPLPWADADVREVVAAVLAAHPEVASCELGPGDGDRDLAIELTLAGDIGRDVGQLATSVGAEVMARLGGRLRRGVEIWLG
jgi:hypothetical protein